MQEIHRDAFPSLLQQIPDPPERLYALGNPEILQQGFWLALVGTRRPSPYGLRAAHAFSRRMLAAGFHLISGLARGIDAVAHRASLLARRPTVAVLGHGLDRIYPAQHRGLAQDIVEAGGCLLSEYPPGTPPQPYHFPRRNRLISGMSSGVLVVEAGLKSGSLTTARHAGDQGREVFVVPGPYDCPGFLGSHWLIQQGAKLVLSLDQVIEELRPGQLPFATVLPSAASGNPIRELLKLRGVVGLDELVLKSEQSLAQIHQALESLREEGAVVEIAPQKFAYAGE